MTTRRKTRKSLEDEIFTEVQQTIDESRKVFLVGDLDEEMTRSVIERLILLAEKSAKRPIDLVISTYGGSTYEAFCIYDVIKMIPCPVRTVGLGKIMSAGVLLLASGQKGHRKLGKHAQILYHAAADEKGGNAFEIKSFSKQFEKEELEYDVCMSKETGTPLEKIRALYTCRDENGDLVAKPDRYLSPDEALDLGIIDVILDT